MRKKKLRLFFGFLSPHRDIPEYLYKVARTFLP
jgi:hypothetical protein